MSDYDAAFKSAFGGGQAEPSAYDEAFASVMPKAATEMPQQKADAVTNFSGNLRLATPFGTIDTRIPLPESVNRGLAQFGSGIADYGMATAEPKAVDEKRARDKILNDGFTGGALHFLGKAAPAVAIPQVGGPVVGGMLVGGALGAIEPVGTGESRLFNTASSAALGGAIPAAIKGFQAMARPNGVNQDLARSALSQNIPVGIADMTDSKFLKATRSVLNDSPFIGGIGDTQRQATQQGFNRAVGKTFGADAPNLTPEVVGAAKDKIGGELNRVWNSNSLKIDGQFVDDLTKIANDAATKLNPEQAAMVNKHIQNLLGKADNSEIAGSFANNWQSELRMAADGEKGLAQKTLSDLRKAALSAFNRGVAPADAAALTKARGQYGAFKTVEPLLNKAEAGVGGRITGDVPAALFPQQVVSQYGSAGRSPFGDLPQIGSQFLVDRTPKTGGSMRAALQNFLVGSSLLGGGGGAGAVAAGMGLGAGAVGTGIGAGVGLGGSLAAGSLLQKILGSPTVAKSVLSDPVAVRGLLDNPEMSKMLIELAKNSGYRLPIAAGAGLLSTPALE